jgi:addiction module RelE/StbE family toxin
MEVVRTQKFNKKLLRLPKHIRESFADRFELFLEEPYHPILRNHQLLGDMSGFRSINITGDYRLIFKIISPDAIALIDLGTHHNLYGN